jgi:1,6-anhydro-N-acetylmuramate kinase
MSTANHAIKMARFDGGWAWTLVNNQGQIAASGVAAEQLEAMTAAWLAARSAASGPSIDYPEITVETVQARRSTTRTGRGMAA